jgi:hemoglobin-like flavoprotein
MKAPATDVLRVMRPEQVELIRGSFDAIWPFRRKFAGLFYNRFFELAPDTKVLFSGDLDRQHLKLMDMVAAIVGALDQREMFQSLIRYSAHQHARLGVKSSHFVAFGEALIWSLQQQFGPAFTPEVREAWTALYASVKNEMMGVQR